MTIRKLAQRVSSAFLKGNGCQLVHKRFAGGLPVKPNKYIEDMAYRRENIEKEFRWTGRSLTNFVIFAGIVPYFIYTYCIKEFNMSDERAGRPKRDMWGSTSE